MPDIAILGTCSCILLWKVRYVLKGGCEGSFSNPNITIDPCYTLFKQCQFALAHSEQIYIVCFVAMDLGCLEYFYVVFCPKVIFWRLDLNNGDRVCLPRGFTSDLEGHELYSHLYIWQIQLVNKDDIHNYTIMIV